MGTAPRLLRRPGAHNRLRGVCGAVAVGVGVLALGAVTVGASTASAAKSDFCAGGNFSIRLASGATLSGAQTTTIPAAQVGAGFTVQGTNIRFGVRGSDFSVRDYTFIANATPGNMTAGTDVNIFAEKTPDLQGSTLTGNVSVELGGADLTISRAGSAAAIKIQAKDCTQGGIFQMEPSRTDGGKTVVTHRLAASAFYYDNPNFRARIGTTVPFVEKDGSITQLPVTARVNIGSDIAPRFVGRDSTQVATRIAQPGCANAFGTQCGGITLWSVDSGGRLGGVMGEDAVEVAPSPTNCTHQCQAQNRIRGRAVVLGFPSPVPANAPYRLTPRLPV